MWKKLLAISVSSSLIIIYSLKRYFGGQYCTCKQRLDGKVVIITGATSGIGKATAIILASKGAEVILACRDVVTGRSVAADIRNKTGNQSVECEALDLAHFESIIDFVNRFKLSGRKLNGLLNNAGLFHVPYQLTDDGYDLTFQTNYLGPFLLTYLLIDTLKASAPSRIVNIGSESHHYPKTLDFDFTKHYTEDEFNKFIFYGHSKLCLMIFSFKLARDLQETGVTVNCANPGNVRSNIHRHFAQISDLPWLSVSRFLLWLTFKTTYQGAQTSVHLLTDPALATVSGKYFRYFGSVMVENRTWNIKLEAQPKPLDTSTTMFVGYGYSH